MLANNGPDSRLCWARGQTPTSENPLGGSDDFLWGVKRFEEEEARERCGVAGADEKRVRPLDAEDEEKGPL